MRARAAAALLGVLLLGVGLTGCGGPTVDLKKGLELEIVSSGWLDAGLVNGQQKLVPALIVKLKNVSDQNLVSLQVNAVFRQVTEAKEWGTGFVTAAGSEGLAAGATSAPITVKSHLGYTGTEPRADMLKNSRFVDAKVDLFAKYAAIQWVKIGEYPITRQLLVP